MHKPCDTYHVLRIKSYFLLKTKTDVPAELEGILDKETFTKARLYALDKANFGAIQGWFSQVLSTVILVAEGYYIFWSIAGKFMVSLVGLWWRV